MTKVPTIYDIGNGIPFPDYTNGTVINAADVGPINGIAHSRLFTINQPGWVYLYSYSESFFRINITGAPDPTTLTELHTFPFVAKNYTGGQGYMDCISFIPVQRACKIYLNNEVNENDQTVHSLIIYYPFVKLPVTPPEGCVSYVIETGHNADNTAFYRKYSDGYIEQWGYSSYESKSEGQISVTYVTPFSSNVNFPTITPVGDNGTDMEAYVYPNSVNSTGFSWYANQDSYVAGKKTEQPGLFTNLKGAYWHACGY